QLEQAAHAPGIDAFQLAEGLAHEAVVAEHEGFIVSLRVNREAVFRACPDELRGGPGGVAVATYAAAATHHLLIGPGHIAIRDVRLQLHGDACGFVEIGDVILDADAFLKLMALLRADDVVYRDVLAQVETEARGIEVAECLGEARAV